MACVQGPKRNGALWTVWRYQLLTKEILVVSTCCVAHNEGAIDYQFSGQVDCHLRVLIMILPISLVQMFLWLEMQNGKHQLLLLLQNFPPPTWLVSINTQQKKRIKWMWVARCYSFVLLRLFGPQWADRGYYVLTIVAWIKTQFKLKCFFKGAKKKWCFPFECRVTVFRSWGCFLI